MIAQPSHIRLELARETGHPDGDPHTGYDIVAFLNAEGALDLASCRDQVDRCRVRRFSKDVTVSTGHLRHTTGDCWILDFPGGDRDDAIGFRLSDERFVPGEYVSLIAGDGVAHTYAVRSVTDI